MKVKSSITSSSVRVVGSFKKVPTFRHECKGGGFAHFGSTSLIRSAIAFPCAWLRSAFARPHISHAPIFQFFFTHRQAPFAIMDKTKATNFLRLIAFGLDNTYNYFSIFASVSSRIACRNVVRYSEKLTRSSA